MPTAKAGAQCRVPVPRRPPRHGGRRGRQGQARPTGASEADRGKRGRWGQARLVGAGEANGGRKPPGQIPSQQIHLFVEQSVFRKPSSLDFGGLRLRCSFGWSWSTCFVSFFHLLSSHFCTCLRLIFPLVLCFHCDFTSVVDLLRVWTCFVHRLAACFDLLRPDLPTSFRRF